MTGTLPTEPAHLPYGFYLLMVLVNDIPSTAQIIRIDAGEGTAVGTSEPPEVPTLRPKLQAFPSPFTDRVTITIEIARPEAVRLRIYDAPGRAVATLLDDMLAPGKYTLNWRPQAHAAGIYYVQLTTDAVTQARPVVYVK